jgi:hypothetical protein
MNAPVLHLWRLYPLVCVALTYPTLCAVQLYVAAMRRSQRITPGLRRHLVQIAIDAGLVATVLGPIWVLLLLHVPVPLPPEARRTGLVWITIWYLTAMAPALVFLNRPTTRNEMTEMDRRRFRFGS